MSGRISGTLVALAAWMIAAAPAQAHSLQSRIFEGRVGQAAIVMEVAGASGLGNSTPGAGRYFYVKHRISIPLLVLRNGADLVLSEVDRGCMDDGAGCAPKATFRLQTGRDGLSGQWSGGGKSLPVTLKQVGVRETDASAGLSTPQDVFQALPLLEHADFSHPYLRRQVTGETVYSKETVRRGVGTVTATDRLTGIHYIRLSRLPDAAAMARTNRLLDARRLQMVAWGLSCRETAPADSPSAGSLGDWESYDSDVAHVTPSLLVIREGGSTFCNNAHPNNTFDYSVYDLRRGEVFDFNRVLRLTTGRKDDEGEEIRTPAYDALLRKLKPGGPYALNPRSIDRECLSINLLQEGFSLSFNDKGLVFSLTDVPHVMGACMDDYYLVPYRDLKGLWTAEAKAYFPDQ